MTDHEAGVDGEFAVDAIQILAEGGPVPWHALLQALERHALHTREHGLQIGSVVGTTAQRGNAETAIATDDRGDSVMARRGESGIPERLGIVVRVDVNEAGRNDMTRGVDLLRCALTDVTYGDYATPDDGDVAGKAWLSRTVNN